VERESICRLPIISSRGCEVIKDRTIRGLAVTLSTSVVAVGGGSRRHRTFARDIACVAQRRHVELSMITPPE
jgi:hypothetical protein